MKKSYVLVICLILTWCGLWSLSGETQLNSQETGGRADVSLPISQPSSNTSAEAVSPETGEYSELHRTHLKDNSTLLVLVKDNELFLTSSTASSINIGSMTELPVTIDNSTKLLVNGDNPLPEGFSPKELNNISSKKIKLEYSNLKLIPVTLKTLYSMIEAAKNDGVKGFIVNSAYRSLDTQRLIFEANLNSFKKSSKDSAEALARTRQLVALPGNSEHHTGLALDIFSVNGRHRNDFEGTKEQVWLNSNLTDFGFIVRYPKEKTKETNSVYEPWHIRYVGLPLSSFLKEQELCLEEFYSLIMAGKALEDATSLFIGAKTDQRVFIDSVLSQRVQLERVNDEYNLLTLSK